MSKTPDGERKAAEKHYTVTAFDYVRDPVGSRDWTIFWRGWCGRAMLAASPCAPQAAPSEEPLNEVVLCQLWDRAHVEWGEQTSTHPEVWVIFARVIEREVRSRLPAPPEAATPAARDVLAERQRQVSVEGWTPEHDDGHVNDQIAAMACYYAMPPGAREWSAEDSGYGDTFGDAMIPEGWAPKECDRRRELVKAGALILAEIERLDRAGQGQEGRSA